MKPLIFTNNAWRGIRFESINPSRYHGLAPHEFAIGWQRILNCFDVKEYTHFEYGPSRGEDFYYKTWDEVLQHFSKYEHNLDSFTDEVLEFMSEVISEKI